MESKTIVNYKQAVENIRNDLKFYITTHKIKALIIGISGGIDSALVAALAKPVCDELDIPLVGRSLPIKTNKVDEIARAELVGDAFCTLFKTEDLTEESDFIQYRIFTEDNENDKEHETKDISYAIRRGNIQARLRMIYLYDLASRYKGMVLSTDNYTEYLLGFWTLHGDVGDFGPIQNLWKTEVYEMAKWVAKNDYEGMKRDAIKMCIEATPTDGLGVSESDYEQIGMNSYSEVDEHLIKFLSDKELADFNGQDLFEYNDQYAKCKVIERHRVTKYKRDNPCNISRDSIMRFMEA